MHKQPISNGTSQIYIEATKIRVVNAVSPNLQSVQSRQIHQCHQIGNVIKVILFVKSLVIGEVKVIKVVSQFQS